MLRILSQQTFPKKLICNPAGRQVSGSEIEEHLGSHVLFKGRPDASCGHLVETSSYFDRLWKRGRQPDRYFIALMKPGELDQLKQKLIHSDEPILRVGKKVKGVYTIVESKPAGKKIKFDD